MASKANGPTPIAEAENLASYIHRIEDGDTDVAKAREHVKSLYKAAAAEGIDEDALKAIVKERKADAEKTAALRVQIARFKKMLGELGDTALGEWAAAAMAAETTARKRSTPKALTQSHLEA